MSDAPNLYGLIATFAAPNQLVAATRAVRDAGYQCWEASTPYPVHGLDEASGRRPTRLAWLTLLGGLAGMTFGLVLCWYANATSFPVLSPFRGYPLEISGKPTFSLAANIPVIFETTILFAALATVAGLIARGRMPEWHHPLFDSPEFARASSDRFVLSVEAADARFDREQTAALLREHGATTVTTVERRARQVSAASRAWPRGWWYVVAALLVLGSAGPAWIAYTRTHRSSRPHVQLLQDMGVQPVLKAQAKSKAFSDRRAMRPQPAGTVAQRPGAARGDAWLYQGVVVKDGQQQWADALPPALQAAKGLAERGQRRFEIYCAACHGTGGGGNGPVAARARTLSTSWVPPASLLSEQVRAQADGYIFHIITDGVRTMPAHGPQVPTEDRWAIVAYVRQLQRNN